MKRKTSTMELLKILSDPRRSRILHLASDKPVTVKILAEQLGEDPLRLYYHVKKMVKAELLEVKETRQHGNLTEHYYQAADLDGVIYKGNIEEQAEHLETTVALIHRRLDPGLRLIQKGLEKVREEKAKGGRIDLNPYHVDFISSTSRKTGREWRESLGALIQKMNKSEESVDLFESDDRDEVEGTYQYVLISYRIEDAEELGLVDPSEVDLEED
ncbi:helix-turn-helix transcriptional regulator [Cohnella pontilimi]|uniref:Helix-turn-helix transcriptional regulator n=1 Tax=Cohnella pontilimi TaxID=2564100 RepID=A0A4U0FAH6_9BACL|nr:winged helix-turn-helix domain-containing protein [Cohnella pontilimi]TJY41796.1 helix-turn-helix transcriptional regulator [Cohnella pontilimi]